MTGAEDKGMKLQELKAKTREFWELYCWFHDAVIQPELFKTEIRRQFGDLRKRSTWEAAVSRYRALCFQVGLLDADRLILHDLNITPDRWEYPYRHQILDEWLTLPDGLELIKTGLEILFGDDYTPEERKAAHGFFELVQESTGGELRGFTAQSVGQLQASAIAG